MSLTKLTKNVIKKSKIRILIKQILLTKNIFEDNSDMYEPINLGLA